MATKTVLEPWRSRTFKSYFVTFVTFVISDYYSAATADSEAIG